MRKPTEGAAAHGTNRHIFTTKYPTATLPVESYIHTREWMRPETKQVVATATSLDTFVMRAWMPDLMDDLDSLSDMFKPALRHHFESIMHNAYWLGGVSLDTIRSEEAGFATLPLYIIRRQVNKPNDEPLMLTFDDDDWRKLFWGLIDALAHVKTHNTWPPAYVKLGMDISECPDVVSDDDVERSRAIAILKTVDYDRPHASDTDDTLITLYQAIPNAIDLRNELIIRDYLPMV